MPAKSFLLCNVTHSQVPVIRACMALGDPLSSGIPLTLREEGASGARGRSESEYHLGSPTQLSPAQRLEEGGEKNGGRGSAVSGSKNA